jgi:hypothetical protein
MAQPIVGNYYTFTLMGKDTYFGKCIGITYSDFARAGLVDHRTIVAFFSPNDNVSHNVVDYSRGELLYAIHDDFAKLTSVESQQITSSTGGNSSSSPVVVAATPPPLTGGRRRKSKKSRKAKKVKKQSRRRV